MRNEVTVSDIRTKQPYNTYLINKELYIGVSAILNCESMGDFLVPWALRTFGSQAEPILAHKAFMESVSATGTAIHKYIELDLLGEKADDLVNDQTIAAIESYHKWKSENKVEVITLEKVVHHEDWRCAGTLDAVLKVNDKLYIVDFKTGKFKPRYFTQLSAYWAMLCAEPKKKRIAGIEDAEFAVLEVLRDGSSEDAKFITLGDKYHGEITREDELGLFHALRYVWYMRNLKSRQFQPIIKNMDSLLSPMEQAFQKTFNLK